jgi:Rad3-related DNA helicase
MCIYWREKVAAMKHGTATLTFSFLIYDNFLPVCAPDGGQISFGNRDLLVVDEAHALEEQVAELHAGFTLSPQRLKTKALEDYDEDHKEELSVPGLSESDEPDDIADLYTFFTDAFEELLEVDYADESIDSVTVEMMQPVFDELRHAISQKINWLKAAKPDEPDELNVIVPTIKRITRVAQSLRMMEDVREQDTPWVIDIDGSDNTVHKAEVKPVYVDTFLEQYVWSRADKIVLSTATMPYRSDPNQWLERIGLNPSTADVISRPMPFDAKNRPVDISTTVGCFSGDGWSENLDNTCEQLEQLYQKHAPEKGLIHTVGYGRAEDLHDAFPERTLLDDRERQMDNVIEQWQESDRHMLLSPRMMEGIDLQGDTCRWQVLAKTPYQQVDARVGYLLDEMDDWRWYKETAALRAIQAAGRAVRSKDDYAKYYILDETITDVLTPNTVPDWFQDAMWT